MSKVKGGGQKGKGSIITTSAGAYERG